MKYMGKCLEKEETILRPHLQCFRENKLSAFHFICGAWDKCQINNFLFNYSGLEAHKTYYFM